MLTTISDRLNRFGRALVKGMLAGAGVCFALALVLISPVGRKADRLATTHLKNINERRINHRLAWLDVAECFVIFHSIAIVGRVVAPEASKVLWHYLHGGGDTLQLDHDYIRHSPVIAARLKSLRVGEGRRFTLRMNEERRIAYALNPFWMRREKNRAVIWQKIRFKDDRSTFTVLNYNLGSVRIPDALVHVLHPDDFIVYCSWSI